MLYRGLRTILFWFNPEDVHYVTLYIFRSVRRVPVLGALVKRMIGVSNITKPIQALGLTFKNQVGLAAGFDKDARFIPEFAELGFGFIEVGTVTPLAQSGNPKPRLFRLPKDQAIINRMGFNNAGADEMAKRLQKKPAGIIVGVNIGKNKVTPNEEALHDYEMCFTTLYDGADYFVINVSSPNTPGLRALQDKEPLRKLLEHILSLRVKEVQAGKIQKPVLLKIAPDLSQPELDDVIDLVLETKIDGIVATNTTISRADLITETQEIEGIGAGGLSGKPLFNRATDVVRYISEKSGGKIFIIGVGGIFSALDAKAKFAAGASLVQLYSGFIYQGPGLIRDILESQ